MSDAESDPERDAEDLGNLLRRMQRPLGIPDEGDEEGEPSEEEAPEAKERDLEGALDEALGLLGRLMDRLPQDLARLGAEAMQEARRPEPSVDERVGQPDWALHADVRSGDALHGSDALHVRIAAEFDLTELLALETWAEAGGPGEEESPEEPPVAERLALVREAELLRCDLPGVAGGEARLVGAEIFPVRLRQDVLHVELAPVLVLIAGDDAPLPLAASTEGELAMPVERFDEGEPFEVERTVEGSLTGPITVRLRFRMLDL